MSLAGVGKLRLAGRAGRIDAIFVQFAVAVLVLKRVSE
jgi:hypothetical protein